MFCLLIWLVGWLVGLRLASTVPYGILPGRKEGGKEGMGTVIVPVWFVPRITGAGLSA